MDDEPDLCELIADALADDGHEVTCAQDGTQALSAASTAIFDVVLADMRLPQIDGLTLFRRLRQHAPTTDMILMTADASVADAVAVLKEGAFDYLTKPVRLDELSIQLARLASYRGLNREVATARQQLQTRSSRDRLVGHSPGMLSMIKRLDAIAQSDAPVVITGESGTGKELTDAPPCHQPITRDADGSARSGHQGVRIHLPQTSVGGLRWPAAESGRPAWDQPEELVGEAQDARFGEAPFERRRHTAFFLSMLAWLWLQSLGLKAVLPPPEEVKEVKTAIGAARAEQSAGSHR